MSLLATALLIMACGQVDRLTRPGNSTGVPAARLFASTVDGCGRIRVHVQGRDSITTDVTAEIDGQCDSLQVVVAGTPSFDRVTQQITLPLALKNTSHRKIKPPAWLAIDVDSITVLFPTGIARNEERTYVDLPAPDSVGAAGGPVPGASVWGFDTVLATPPAAQVLPGGTTSRPRFLRISLKQGVQTLEIAIRSHGRYAVAEVPAVAPDSVPAGFFDDVVDGAGCITGQILRNIVILGFRDGTLQAQRQEAVDAVEGEVVGGEAEEDLYYIRVPDEGSPRAVCRAIATLDSLPQVDLAVAYSMEEFSPQYRKPYDGPDFRTWAVRPALAAGPTWALDAINAPLAWGCSVGDRSTPIAIVDGEFAPVTELTANVTRPEKLYPFPGHARHGAAVAAVLGANGNDSVGITGTMWRSSLRLYDPAAIGTRHQRTTSAVAQSIFQAATGGARVINMSIGITWPRPPLSVPGKEKADSVFVQQTTYRLITALNRAATKGYEPLLVLAAGNDTTGLSTFWTGGPALAKAFPTRVLVVTGMSRSGDQQYQSGPEISIAAPSDQVTTETSDGPPVYWSGTSFSAPLVSGIAGLLLSFDPRLTAAELRDLIIRGARAGGRTVRPPDGSVIPVADAWESLKLAGRRPGARLCGTRLWTEAGELWADRDGGPESLFNIGGASRYTNALHGGDRVLFFDEGIWDTREIARGSNGVWQAVPVESVPRPLLGATYLSQYGVSHNADSLVSAGTAGVFVARNQVNPQWRQIGSVPMPAGGSGGDSVCWAERFNTCEVGYIGIGSSYSSNAMAAYSPMGDSVYVAVNTRFTSTTSWGATEHCRLLAGVDTSHILDETRCPHFGTNAGTLESKIYAVPVYASGGPRLVYTAPSSEVLWLGVAEGGSEFVAQLRSVTSYVESQGGCVFVFDGAWNYCGLAPIVSQTTVRDCRYEWRSRSGALLLTRGQPDDCYVKADASVSGARRVGIMQAAPRPGPVPLSPFVLRSRMDGVLRPR